MEEEAQVTRKASVQARVPGRLLSRSFFEEPPEQVAPRLLGKVLAHRTRGAVLAGRIVEVEAYMGPHNDPPDPASHSHRGPTPRNSVLFGPAGYSYVYVIYGRYSCMNVSCETEGHAGGILIRALEPLPDLNGRALARMALNRGLPPDARPSELTSGPGRLCQALGIDRQSHNGLDLVDSASPLQIRDDGWATSEIFVTARIGINVAVDWPLRFALPGHHCVSGAKSLSGRCIPLR
jgi:DNA-3-methyladenine glycosylase